MTKEAMEAMNKFSDAIVSLKEVMAT